MVMMFSLSCVGVVAVVCWSLAGAGSLPTGGFAENTPFCSDPPPTQRYLPTKNSTAYSFAVRVASSFVIVPTSLA